MMRIIPCGTEVKLCRSNGVIGVVTAVHLRQSGEGGMYVAYDVAYFIDAIYATITVYATEFDLVGEVTPLTLL